MNSNAYLHDTSYALFDKGQLHRNIGVIVQLVTKQAGGLNTFEDMKMRRIFSQDIFGLHFLNKYCFMMCMALAIVDRSYDYRQVNPSPVESGDNIHILW